MLLRKVIAAALFTLIFVSGPATGVEPNVHSAWARATPPGTDRGAGYLIIENTSKKAILLTGARTAPAAQVAIHETRETDGRVHMEHLDDGLAIPARETVALEPMGPHLMLMELEQPLRAGQQYELQLEFGNGKVMNTSLEVRSPNHDSSDSAHNH